MVCSTKISGDLWDRPLAVVLLAPNGVHGIISQAVYFMKLISIIHSYLHACMVKLALMHIYILCETTS